MSLSSRCAVRLAVSSALALAVLVPPSALAVSSPFAVDNPFISDGLKTAADDRDRDNSPAAAAEREQSRRRYADLSAAESLALGRRSFPEAFAIDLFDGENPAPGLQIVDYTSRTTAIAEGEDGERLLVQSTAPLRAETANGQMAPVDLKLRESTDTFTTTNSNADIQISKNVEDGASLLAKDVTIKPVVARNADGQKTDGRVYFPSVDIDTDYIVVPAPHGGEVGWLLRSADSPERFLLDVDMPAGASIRRPQPEKPIPGDPPRGLEIVKDGKPLVAITAPIAYDANHAPVKTQLSIVGEHRIAMSVEHRGKDLAYPLYADPEVMILANNPNWWYGWGPAWYSHGANYNTTTNYYGVALLDPSYNANGIYLSMPTNQTYWPRNTGVNWSYKAPVDSYIYRAIMGHVGLNGLEGNTYKWYSWGYRFAYLYSGLMNPTRSNWDAGQDWVARLNGTQYAAAGGIFGPNPDARAGWDFDHCYSRCNNLAGSDQNEAILGLAAINNYNNNNIATGDAKASVTMNYAQIYLGDRFAPSMRWDAAPASRDWRDDSASPTQTITPTALDRGLGVKSITLSDAATGNGAVSSPCTGHPQLSPCQTAWTAYAGFRYTLNEGLNTMSLTPHDIIGNVGAPAIWTEKIDRDAPAITLSGALSTRDDDTLEAGDYALHIESTDGTTTQGQAGWRSGVTRVEILLDGDRVLDKLVSCTRVESSCSVPADWTFSTAEYPGGDHDIVVRATDAVGHVSSRTLVVYTIDIDRAEPQADEDDNSGDAAERALWSQQDSQLFCDPAYDSCDPSTGDSAARSASAGAIFGISDQKASVFGDSRLQSLNVTQARLVAEYDVVLEALGQPPAGEDPATYYRTAPLPSVTGATPEDRRNHPSNRVRRVDRWMTKVCPNPSGGCDLRPMVSFWYDRKDTAHTPSVAEYVAATRAFRQRYPYVTLYTSWNEVNSRLRDGQGNPIDSFSIKPFLAGQLWDALDKECHPSGQEICVVGAGGFLDLPNLNGRPSTGYDGPAGNKTYFGAYVQGMGRRRPPGWALNAYSTINRLTTSRLSDFVVATRARRVDGTDVSPNIWLTEQGGRLRFHNEVVDYNGKGAQRQQASVKFLVGNPDSGEQGIVNQYPRISRVYYYPWRGDPSDDDGLTAYRNNMPVRPAFYCLRTVLNQQPGDRDKCLEPL